MLSTVKIPRATALGVRRGERKQIVGSYVRQRLRDECKVRGVAAKIAREIGFSSAHLANIQKEDRGIGDDFAEAIAKYWGMTQAQLVEVAVAWASEQDSPAPSSKGAVLIMPPKVSLANRDEAARLAQADGVWQPAIDSVLEDEVGAEEAARSVLEWARRMKLRELEMMKHGSGVMELVRRKKVSRS